MKVLLVLALLVPLPISSLSAQLIQLTDESNFSADRARLDFSVYASGAEASRALAAWGVAFSNGSSSQPRIGEWLDPSFQPVPAFPVPVVQNRGGGDTGSANLPLVIDFQTPLRRAGFVLHGGISAGGLSTQGDSGSVMTIRIAAFDSEGASLGEIQRETEGLGTESDPTLFLGIESASQTPISKVLLDYGNSPNFEEVEAILADFPTPPRFVASLPQIADGPLPEGALLFSVTVSNIENQTVTGTLFLKRPDGSDLSLELNGVQASAFPFELAPFQSVQLNSSGNLPEAVRGYALVESVRPVIVSELLRALDTAGRPVQEVGLDSVAQESLVMAPVTRRVELGVDTGVAIANLSNSDVMLTLFLSPTEGNLLTRVRTLMPGEQIAAFLDELFASSGGQPLPVDLDGSLLISASSNVSVTVLRTIGGVVSATLPAGSLQRQR